MGTLVREEIGFSSEEAIDGVKVAFNSTVFLDNLHEHAVEAFVV